VTDPQDDPIERSVADALPAMLKRLWRFGLTLSGEADRADDLVQSTCLRALERASQYRQGTRLDSWLYAIMVSIWRNQLRANTVRTGRGLVDAADAGLASPPDQAEEVFYLHQVMEKISALPEGQRSAILLVSVEGMTYREASQILDVPMGTVMSRLSAARRALNGLIDCKT